MGKDQSREIAATDKTLRGHQRTICIGAIIETIYPNQITRIYRPIKRHPHRQRCNHIDKLPLDPPHFDLGSLDRLHHSLSKFRPAVQIGPFYTAQRQSDDRPLRAPVRTGYRTGKNDKVIIEFGQPSLVPATALQYTLVI